MEQQTIDHIERNVTALKAAERLGCCQEEVALIPDGYSVARLEQYLEQPYRFRGIYTTTSMRHFMEYANQQKEVFCLVDPAQMIAVAYFDLGNPDNPGHGDHRARLTLKQSAPYAELLSRDGAFFSQKDFAEWMEDWRNYIKPANEGGQDINIKSAIQAVRKVTINEIKSAEHAQSNFSSAKSTMEKIDASSEEQLPTGITFSCQPYGELSEHSFNLRVSLLTGDAPRFRLRIIQIETAQEEMAEEFSEKLASGIESENSKVFIGEFSR